MEHHTKVYTKFIKNTAIFGISNFASKILVFLLLPLYTRTMSSDALGRSDLIISLISFLLPLFTLCVYEGVLRFGMDRRLDIQQVFTYGLYVIALGFVILLFCAQLFKNVLGNNLILFYLIYIFTCLNQYFNQFARALDKIKLIGIVGVIGTVILVGANIIFLYYKKLGLEGYLISYLLMNLIVSFVLFINGKLYKFITFKRIDLNIQKEIFHYNGPLVPSKINWWMISISNRYILGYLYGTNLVGLYTAANKLPSVITTVYGIVQQALLLSVIEEEEKKTGTIYKQINKLMGFVLAIAAVAISLGSTWGAGFLFGDNFYAAWKLVPLLVLSAYFGSLHGNITTIYMARKNTKVLFCNSLIGMISSLVFNFIFIKFMGLNGAVFAIGLTYFTVWFHLYYLNRKEEHASNNWIVTILLSLQAITALYTTPKLYCSINLVSLVFILLLYKKEVWKMMVFLRNIKTYILQ